MKKIFKIVIPAAMASMLAMACAHNGHKKNLAQQTSSVTTQTENTSGQKLMEKYCLACHTTQPGHGHENELKAPPFPGVTMYYKKQYPAKKDFMEAIAAYVPQPDSTKSLMPGAVKRFGLMPPMPIPQDSIKAIASYLYDTYGHMKRQGHGKGMGKGMGKCGRGK